MLSEKILIKFTVTKNRERIPIGLENRNSKNLRTTFEKKFCKNFQFRESLIKERGTLLPNFVSTKVALFQKIVGISTIIDKTLFSPTGSTLIKEETRKKRKTTFKIRKTVFRKFPKRKPRKTSSFQKQKVYCQKSSSKSRILLKNFRSLNASKTTLLKIEE